MLDRLWAAPAEADRKLAKFVHINIDQVAFTFRCAVIAGDAGFRVHMERGRDLAKVCPRNGVIKGQKGYNVRAA